MTSCPPAPPDPPAPPASPAGDAPKRVTVDNRTVEQHSLADQLDAADRADATAVARSRRIGVRFSRIYPGGTSGR
jgi:hypothetical protein